MWIVKMIHTRVIPYAQSNMNNQFVSTHRSKEDDEWRKRFRIQNFEISQ